MNNQNSTSRGRSFSLGLYLLIVFGLSWPFQIISAIWATDLLLRCVLNGSSMIMVTIGTLIAGRYVFRDGFAGAGWRWGKPQYYLTVLGLVALLWVVPTLIDLAIGTLSLPSHITKAQIAWIFVLLFVVIIPAFGEEFGWRGYMLPRLARRLSVRNAVVVHGVILWAWHLPLLVGVGVHAGIAGAGGLPMAATVAIVVFGSAIPAILHGVVIAYIWTRSRSLAVATVYHAAYDGVRDSLQTTIGYSPIAGAWVNVLLIILGIAFLWKGNWKNLEAAASVSKNSGNRST